MGIWDNVPLGLPDAILCLTDYYNQSTNPRKINVGVGVYRDENNKPFVLNAVRKAEELIKNDNKEYAPINGIPEFNLAATKLAYADVPKHLAVCQTLSGSGALKIAGDFIKKYHSTRMFLPNPTWDNHRLIFDNCGMEILYYSYLDKKTNGLDFNGMMADLSKLKEGDSVLLHACAHNPTGVDPSFEQWKEIQAVTKKNKVLVVFDMAYQGFASGDTDLDAKAVRYFVENGSEMLLCQSFAKNFGLYGERAGCLSVVCTSDEEVKRVESQIKIIVRGMYSNPPIHGAKIVNAILNSQELEAEWRSELKTMADRIIKMRKLLQSNLSQSKLDWSHITNQIGMFCFTGLNKEQVTRLAEEFHIFLTMDGRISISGITEKNVKYLADCIHKVTQ